MLARNADLDLVSGMIKGGIFKGRMASEGLSGVTLQKGNNRPAIKVIQSNRTIEEIW